MRFPAGELKVPHVGWNRLDAPRGDLLAGVADGAYAYFVHSYYVMPEDTTSVLATTEYGVEFASVVGRERLWGAQFHPEKSQEIGLRMLKNYARLVEEIAKA